MTLTMRTLLRRLARLARAVPGSAVNANPRPRRRTAWQAIFWGATAILAVNVALSVSVEKLFPQVRDPEYGYRLVRLDAQQRAHPDRPLVVLVGTSRTQNGIDAHAMGFPDEPGSPVVFNFGTSGTQPLRLRLNLQRLHDAGIRPAAVLVEILPYTLSVAAPVDHLFHEHSAQLTAADVRWLEPYLADPAALHRRWAVSRLTPWATHRRVILSHVAPKLQAWQDRVDFMWATTDDRGFAPYPHEATSAEDRKRRRAKVAAEATPVLRDLRVSELTRVSFRGLVSDCRARGIPVAFYEMPESPIYRSWYSSESLAAVAAFKRMLRDELSCPVFEVALNFAEEDFADGHHILPSGAERFSRTLADQHLKPWFASGR